MLAAPTRLRVVAVALIALAIASVATMRPAASEIVVPSPPGRTIPGTIPGTIPPAETYWLYFPQVLDGRSEVHWLYVPQAMGSHYEVGIMPTK